MSPELNYMAKGNDGNYLQHSVELALAVALAQSSPDGGLHIMLTHGMAPTQACGSLPHGQTRKALCRALQLGQASPSLEEPAVVKAYRATNASLEKYPNSAELIAASVGRLRLSGGITEVDRAKHAQLMERWQGTQVKPILGSWRPEMVGAGVHTWASPSRTKSPWLLSMDPMTYSEARLRDDDKLYRADGERIGRALRPFVESGVPGVAIIFAYAVRPNIRPLFWSFADRIAADAGIRTDSCWMSHQGGNRNLVAIFGVGLTFPPAWPPPAVNPGRD